jgi:hypothetical protein
MEREKRKPLDRFRDPSSSRLRFLILFLLMNFGFGFGFGLDGLIRVIVTMGFLIWVCKDAASVILLFDFGCF